jgi:RHS repeat-associated protein
VAIAGSTPASALTVDPNSGVLNLTQEDVRLPGYAVINLTRQYSGARREFGMFGFGWATPWINNLLNASGDIHANLGGKLETFALTNSYWNASRTMQLSFINDTEALVDGGIRGKWHFNTANLTCTRFEDANANMYNFDTTATNILVGSQAGTNLWQNLFLINRITFPDSREMVFEYTSNRCTRVVSPDGRTNHYTYTDGLLTGVSRDSGMALDYGYHTESQNGVTKGWLTSIAYANGAEVNIAYNGEYDTTNQLRVVELTGPHNYVHSYGYESLTNCGCTLKTTLTDGRNNTTVYITDGVKRRIVTNALGYVSMQVSSNNVIVSSTDFRAATEYFVYDFWNTNVASRANLLAVTNTLGKVWSYAYDLNDKRVRAISPVGQTNLFRYDEKGNLLAITNALGRQEVSFSYTSNGVLASVMDARGNVTAFAQNNQGLVTNMVDALTNCWARSYDSSGNLICSLDPLGNATWLGYGAHEGRPTVNTNAAGQVTRLAYDEIGNITNITDALGNSTGFTYDQLQRTTRVRDAFGNETKFCYDAESNLTVLSNALEQVYSYTYDPINKTKAFVYPDASKESYIYDANSNMTVFTNRSGQVITAEYDAGNRLTTKSWEGATNVVFSLGYDDADRLLTVARTKGGVVESAITNTWDAANQMTRQVQDSFAVGYEYDFSGNITNVSYASGLNITYSYDPLNRISAIRDTTNAVPLVAYEYDAAGKLTKRAIENGTENVYAWDAVGRVTNMVLRVTAAPTNVLWSAAYGYDAVGNRTWVKDRNGRGDVYQYDAAYQVTGVKYDVDDPTVGYTSATNPSRTVTYNYDALGNRTSVVDNGNSTSYSINNLNQYTSVAGTNLTYDTRGNLTGDGVWTFGYDYENHLVSAAKSGMTVNYAYDALGRRISKTVNGTTTRYVYSGDNLVEERDGSGAPLAKYVYEEGIDRPVKVIIGANAYWFQLDASGNVAALVNASGQIKEQYTYDVFGRPTISDGSGNALSSSSISFLFAGRECDPETGLYHYRARAYSTTLGRFLQTDPLLFNGTDANIYRYCSNNPVNKMDSFGTATRLSAAECALIKAAMKANEKFAKLSDKLDCPNLTRGILSQNLMLMMQYISGGCMGSPPGLPPPGPPPPGPPPPQSLWAMAWAAVAAAAGAAAPYVPVFIIP